jgi:hypothetical protein
MLASYPVSRPAASEVEPYSGGGLGWASGGRNFSTATDFVLSQLILEGFEMSEFTADSSHVASPAVRAAAPHRFVKPKPPWFRRINYRVVLLAAIALLFIGGPFFVWARDALTGGIVRHGNYADVNLKAMSTFDMDQMTGTPDDIPAKFRALEGQRVHMMGEMWDPTDAGDGGISYFQLVYSKTKCCFNGPPLAQHFVDGNVIPGHTVYYYGNGMVSVWGTLHIHFRRDPDSKVIKSIYEVDVDRVDPV